MIKVFIKNKHMQTIPLYLEDSYLKSVDAKVLNVSFVEDGKYKIILDRTIFYPMGGGQPTDQGYFSNGSWSSDVYQVQIKDGEIYHYIETQTPPKIGSLLYGEIDWERRYKNMRIHSGGHIIDFALYLLDISPTILKPLKADHGKKPFIVYEGEINKEFLVDLENKSNELIKKNLTLSWEFVTLDELKKDAIYLQPNLPTNKPLRKLTLEGVASVADGGTMVKKTSEIGVLKIVDVIQEENLIYIYYKVE